MARRYGDVRKHSKAERRRQYRARQTMTGRTRDFNIKVKVGRQSNLQIGNYYASACFTERRTRPPAKRGLQHWPRCGYSTGKTPSAAFRNALRKLITATKPSHNQYRREWRP